MNVWEALLNRWEGDTQMEWLRDLLYRTLVTFKTAIDLLVGDYEPVWRLPRLILQRDVPVAIGRRARGLGGHMV